eukprot:gb/GEZN01003290.1/.p1 GENE.gb/GEZN01003290.1/~~gb/GEZN01003290.1/.p1  ORF type:complete len:434 (+),score=60.53 gb/GEZN01003290.1/:32-1303(+)
MSGCDYVALGEVENVAVNDYVPLGEVEKVAVMKRPIKTTSLLFAGVLGLLFLGFVGCAISDGRSRLFRPFRTSNNLSASKTNAFLASAGQPFFPIEGVDKVLVTPGQPGRKRTAFQVVDSLPPNVLSGLTVLITGGYSGLGEETARQLLKAGADVVVAGRNADKQSAWLSAMKREFALAPGRLSATSLDLADLKSVQSFAQSWLSSGKPLNVLINNAGVMMPPLSYTAQGVESQFGINVLGPFLLTQLLLPALLSSTHPHTGRGRVLFLSSAAHQWQGLRFQHQWFEGKLPAGVPYDDMTFYQQSKLGNILLAQEFSRRYPLDAVSIHPGIIPTSSLFRHVGALGYLRLAVRSWPTWVKEAPKTVPSGAATIVTCATQAKVVPGQYYTDCAPARPADSVAGPQLQDTQRLFALCEKLTQQFLS